MDPGVRLIDAAALFDRAYEVWFEADAGETNLFMEMINNSPTIDPVEHGHVVWRERQFIGQKFQKGTCLKCGQESTFLMPPVEFDEIPYCSKCGARLSDDYRGYCPKCGAKLDGEPEHIKAWRPESEEENNHGAETGNDKL